MNRILTIGVALAWLAASPGLAAAREGPGEEGEAFVHPFLAHMGLPDALGEVSLRLTGFRQRDGSGATYGDTAYHLEAGLGHRLGLHMRADGLKHEDYSEVMLQYAVLEDAGMRNGLAVFGQVSIPSGPVGGNRYKGLVGVSGTLTYRDRMTWNADVHYDPKDEMGEYESAFVFRGTDQLFPVLEVRGEYASHEMSAYLLPALKVRAGSNAAFGIGYQIAASHDREYETETLLTLETVL